MKYKILTAQSISNLEHELNQLNATYSTVNVLHYAQGQNHNSYEKTMLYTAVCSYIP